MSERSNDEHVPLKAFFVLYAHEQFWPDAIPDATT